MSTKIYYAYRVKKSVPLMPLLRKFTDISCDWMCKNKVALEGLHAMAVLRANQVINKEIVWEDKDINISKLVLEKNEENKPSYVLDLWFNRIMKLAELDSLAGNPLAVNFECCVNWDGKYWYIKFFPNNFGNRMFEEIEKQCKELEDFHYQNQSDPPEDVPYKQFKAREKKWESLLNENFDFSNWLRYTIFDHYVFSKLFSKYFFTGEKDVFKHFSYKFDKPIILKEKPIKS